MSSDPIFGDIDGFLAYARRHGPRPERQLLLGRLIELTGDPGSLTDALERRWAAGLVVRLMYEQGILDRAHFEQAMRSEHDLVTIAESNAKLKDRTAKATETVSARAVRRRQRAMELEAEGLSKTLIGLRMAGEEGHPETPYASTTVFRWLREAKKH